MPPKNKKELEEQTKRLQEEQRKHQQEQAKAAEQKKKYAGQIISSNLFLPASQILFSQFQEKSVSFIQQKILSAILANFSDLKKEDKTINILCKFLILQMKHTFELFQNKKQDQSQKISFIKARIIIGIALKVFLNRQESKKQRKKDKQLIAEQVIKHSQKTQIKAFKTKQLQKIIQHFEITYLRHFCLLHYYHKFEQRSDICKSFVHIAAPTTFYNTSMTPFIDLSVKKQSS